MLLINKILVIGDLILDHYIIGEVSRISPEAPVPVVHVKKKEFRLGGCTNVANNLTKLAIETSVLAVIGDDFHGNIVQNELANEGIENQLIIENNPTICKTRIIGNHQQIVRFDEEIPFKNSTKLISAFQNLILKNQFPFIVISDYNKGVCSEDFCSEIFDYCKKNEFKLIIDPKGINWKKYRGAYLVTPNLKELSEIVNEKLANEDENISKYGKIVLAKFNFENLLVTRSEKGMTLISKEKTIHFPTVVKDVYDITGAGDTVIATVAASLVEGFNLEDSVRRANAAAGFVVSKFGTYAINKNELDNVLRY